MSKPVTTDDILRTLYPVLRLVPYRAIIKGLGPEDDVIVPSKEDPQNSTDSSTVEEPDDELAEEPETNEATISELMEELSVEEDNSYNVFTDINYQYPDITALYIHGEKKLHVDGRCIEWKTVTKNTSSKRGTKGNKNIKKKKVRKPKRKVAVDEKQQLRLSTSQVRTLSGIEHLEELELISISNAENLTNLNVLELCTQLRSIILVSSKLPAMLNFKNNANLLYLNLSENNLTKIEHLEDFPNLRFIYLNNNQISKIGDSLASCKALSEFSIAGNDLHCIMDLTVLKANKNLQRLILANRHTRNPVSNSALIRDHLIRHVPQVLCIDSIDITVEERKNAEFHYQVIEDFLSEEGQSARKFLNEVRETKFDQGELILRCIHSYLADEKSVSTPEALKLRDEMINALRMWDSHLEWWDCREEAGQRMLDMVRDIRNRTTFSVTVSSIMDQSIHDYIENLMDTFLCEDLVRKYGISHVVVHEVFSLRHECWDSGDPEEWTSHMSGVEDYPRWVKPKRWAPRAFAAMAKVSHSPNTIEKYKSEIEETIKDIKKSFLEVPENGFLAPVLIATPEGVEDVLANLFHPMITEVTSCLGCLNQKRLSDDDAQYRVNPNDPSNRKGMPYMAFILAPLAKDMYENSTERKGLCDGADCSIVGKKSGFPHPYHIFMVEYSYKYKIETTIETYAQFSEVSGWERLNFEVTKIPSVQTRVGLPRSMPREQLWENLTELNLESLMEADDLIILDGEEFPKVTSVNFSSNGFTSMSKINMFPKLTHLYLSLNKIKTIDMVAMPKLEFLDLSWNYFNNTHDVWEALRMKCQNLNTLDMTYNPFTDVRKTFHQTAIFFKHLSVQKVNGMTRSEFCDVGVVGTNRVLHDKPTEQQIWSENIVSGTERYVRCKLRHSAQYSLMNSGMKIMAIDTIRPAVRWADLSHNLLLDCSSLKKATNLRELVISGNVITDLEALAVCDLPNLIRLDLSQNYVREIPETLAYAVPKLKHLNLSRNCLTSLKGIETLATLRQLFVSFNQIESVNNLMYVTHCNKLVSLDVSGNEIDYKDFGLVLTHHCPSLKTLNLVELTEKRRETATRQYGDILDRFVLVKMNPEMGHEAKSLQSITFSLGEMTKACLTADFFPNLTTLNVSGGKLQMLFGLHQLPALEYLDVSNNGMGKMSRSLAGLVVDPCGSWFPKLKQLVLKNNGIFSVAPFHLHWMHQLELVDLSANRLTGLRGLEGSVPSLKTLMLNENRVLTLTVFEVLLLPNVRELYLNNNLLTDIEFVVHLDELQKLFVAHNKIDQVIKMKVLKGRKLEELSVNGNIFCKKQMRIYLDTLVRYTQPTIRIINGHLVQAVESDSEIE